ncbi:MULTISPECIES: TniB family NTP-binding protein [Acinetobacter]|uniref:TniB family NTP-binding protein n=1 Tax=Acinetobacter TaxID=469 RepID=UPI00158EF2E3|nr:MULTISPECIES: TniB family NTP-binding protein [Acinetobacter]MCU4365349.1 TniB family NTP-binding protein [Acinetobacter variabilis]MCU4375260.1 TniB family NTP-binding protein [Acinetobacter variabilis]QKW81420.1 TniB family NTP-binding protein [Acinetobacter sp. FDAARGOS_724]BCT87830.1 transposase [Acinetobacter variabilis]
MEKFNHLAAHVREIMVLSDDERINFLYMDRWIGYQRAITVLNMLTDLLNRPKKLRPECLLIVGDSNMGKTTIIHEFAKKYYINKVNDIDMQLLSLTKPVIPIQAPVRANVKELYINILEHFFVPFRTTDPESKLKNQAIHLLRKYETKMLIIDELHNCLSGSSRQQQEVMNALKTLSNELSLNIIGVGTREASLILHTDAQYASRFDILDLPLWKLDEDFLRLLLSYVKLIPLKKPSNLSSQEIATLLHEISGGNLGDLNRVVVECAKMAILTGTEEITLEIIKKFRWLKPTQGVRNIQNIKINRI